MNDNFENQKEKLLAIKYEISLLQQQVNYLLRNEKALGLLDLDVLMNRTHTVYDLLCSINLGEDAGDQDMEIDPEALTSLFGPMLQGEESEVAAEPQTEEAPATKEVIEEEPEVEEEPEAEEEPEPEPEILEPIVPAMEQVEEAPAPVVEEVQPKPVEVVVEEEVAAEEPEIPVFSERDQEEIVFQPVENEQNTQEPEPEEKPLSDEFGFFFRFEDVPAQEETKPEEPADNEGRVVHFVEEVPEEEIPERDRVDGDSLVKDNPLEMPQMEHEVLDFETKLPDMKPEEIEHSEPSEYEDVFKRDDTEFEMATVETLGERMIHEDNSLAAKLQQGSVRDLKSVIGINDKFLFVNELFGGSMEKYNKSIENLNDLKTLNGALIYLNELKIELQWNSSNEAYQKLKELISRKFES